MAGLVLLSATLLSLQAQEVNDDVVADLAKGTDDMKQGQYEAAIMRFTQVILMDPKNAAAYYRRGQVYQQQKDYDKAIADYRSAAMNSGESNEETYKLAECFDLKGDWPNAAHAYEMSESPNSPQGYSESGGCYSAIGGYAEALKNYTKGLQVDPKNIEILKQFAWLKATCPDTAFRDGQNAVVVAAKACELAGWTDPKALNVLAAASAEAGDFDSAVKYANQCLRLPGVSADLADRTKSRLALYQNHQPYHQEESKFVTYRVETQNEQERIFSRGARMGALTGKYIAMLWQNAENNPQQLDFEQLRQRVDGDNLKFVGNEPPGAKQLVFAKAQQPFTSDEQAWLAELSHIFKPTHAITLDSAEGSGMKDLKAGVVLGYYFPAENVCGYLRDFDFDSVTGNMLVYWTSTGSPDITAPGFSAYSFHFSVRPDLRIMKSNMQAVMVPDYAALDTALRGYAQRAGVYAKYYSDSAPVAATSATQPTPETKAKAKAKTSIQERLQELKSLHESGLINDDEYAKKRAAILQEL